MDEEDELKRIMAATAVANALNDGDFEAFADLVDVLRLLPDEAQDDAMQGTYAVFLLCTPTSIMPAEPQWFCLD